MLTVVCALVAGAWLAAPPDIELIGTAVFAGDARDLSGLSDVLSEGMPHDRLGSFGSGIAYTGRGQRYIAVDDRGPADGASEFHARVQELEIEIDAGAAAAVRARLVATKMLRDSGGRQLVGSLRGEFRYDAEGVRVSPTGTIWVSEEYGPRIDEFDPAGRMIRGLRIPARWCAVAKASDPAMEVPPQVRWGRQPNRGIEGLAITPDGSKLVGILQGPLIQDGALDAAGVRRGVHVRLMEIDTQTEETRELVYRMQATDRGINEIVAVNSHAFLVLERDGRRGVEARDRALFLIDTSCATDVSGEESLPGDELPERIVPVTKRLFLDFLSPQFALAGARMPEKIEGLAFGPDLPDGRHVLLVSVDNDMKAEAPTSIYVFAIRPERLPTYVPQSRPPAGEGAFAQGQ